MAFDSRGLLVIPGAQKAGTTSLWRLLLQHESVYSLGRSSRSISRSTPALKEPQFFTLKEDIVKENLDWYTSLIIDDERNGPGWYVDASTGYLYSPRAPELIESLPFPVKFLIILREPAERAFSSFLEMNGKTPPADRRTFAEIISFVWDNRSLGLAKAEKEQLETSKEGGKIDTDYLLSHVNRLKKRFKIKKEEGNVKKYLQNPMWCYNHLQGSLYSKWLVPFEESKKEVMIVSLDEMTSNTEQTANEIFDYLGLEYNPVKLAKSNETWHSPLWVRRMRNFASGIVPGQGWWEYIRGVLPHNIAANKSQIKDKNKTSVERARRLLKEEIKYWSNRKKSVLRK